MRSALLARLVCWGGRKKSRVECLEQQINTSLPQNMTTHILNNANPIEDFEERASLNGDEHEYMDQSDIPTEEDRQAQRERAHAELLKQAEKIWEEVQLLQALLHTSPSLRAISGKQVKQCHKHDLDCCSICLEDHCDDEQYRRLPCHHVFHVDCVDSWFKSRVTCPICKASVVDSIPKCDRDAAMETIRINKELSEKNGTSENTPSLNEAQFHTQLCSPQSRISMASQYPIFRVASRRHMACV